MQALTFDQLPTAVADLCRKVDYLTSLLTTSHNSAPVAIAEEPDLVTIKKAAELVDLAVPTIYAMVGRNEIPFMKRSKKLYFSRQELESWIREGRQKTSEECAKEVRQDLDRLGSHQLAKKGGRVS
jgi:excisionase family DNA binding protein